MHERECRDRAGAPLSTVDRIGERVSAEVTQVLTAQSRWLFDLARSRFQRCSPRQDLGQAIAFGAWLPLRRAWIDGHALVVETFHRPTVRVDLVDA
jgi:hypothetical protein